MKQPLPYAQALHIAEGFMADIGEGCARIEIAGSLRRKKETVGDIEIVAIPKYAPAGFDLFGYPMPEQNILEKYLVGYSFLKDGPKYKQIALKSINVDLFITCPECWGVIFTIRTGSSDFSKWLVTSRQHGGAMPSNMKVIDGRLWAGKTTLETPEEIDFFANLRVNFIQPAERIAGRWHR